MAAILYAVNKSDILKKIFIWNRSTLYYTLDLKCEKILF